MRLRSQRALDRSARSRPSADELLVHAWVTSVPEGAPRGRDTSAGGNRRGGGSARVRLQQQPPLQMIPSIQSLSSLQEAGGSPLEDRGRAERALRAAEQLVPEQRQTVTDRTAAADSSFAGGEPAGLAGVLQPPPISTSAKNAAGSAVASFFGSPTSVLATGFAIPTAGSSGSGSSDGSGVHKSDDGGDGSMASHEVSAAAASSGRIAAGSESSAGPARCALPEMPAESAAATAAAAAPDAACAHLPEQRRDVGAPTCIPSLFGTARWGRDPQSSRGPRAGSHSTGGDSPGPAAAGETNPSDDLETLQKRQSDPGFRHRLGAGLSFLLRRSPSQDVACVAQSPPRSPAFTSLRQSAAVQAAVKQGGDEFRSTTRRSLSLASLLTVSVAAEPPPDVTVETRQEGALLSQWRAAGVPIQAGAAQPPRVRSVSSLASIPAHAVLGPLPGGRPRGPGNAPLRTARSAVAVYPLPAEEEELSISSLSPARPTAAQSAGPCDHTTRGAELLRHVDIRENGARAAPATKVAGGGSSAAGDDKRLFSSFSKSC